jgi:HPt (histidine-containing phosphotransfer) domain-containing protein
MNPALEALKARFIARCADDRLRLAEALQTGDLDGVKHTAHKLAGAAGTFGFPELSRAAMTVEDQIDLGQTPDSESVARLDAMLRELSAS